MGKLTDLFFHCVYGITDEPNPQRCETCGVKKPQDRDKLYDKWLNEYVWWCPRANIMVTKQAMAFTYFVGCIEWIEPKGGIRNE